MKAFKKICTALMLLAFAFVFASCSNGSDSDDDDSNANGLPSSVGKNVLAGNSYKFVKVGQKETKTTIYVFKDNTVTETKTVQPTGLLEETPETEIFEHNYTYDADAGLLSLQCVSWTSDDIKMTSMNEFYAYLVKAGEVETVEEAKEYFGDQDIFAEKISMCYFVKDDGNILLGNYFNEGKVGDDSKFNYLNNGNIMRLKGEGVIELTGKYGLETGIDIKIDSNAKTISSGEYADEEIEGSYTATKPTKTLKELNGDDKLNEANGYIMVKFSKLPSEMSSALYNMETGTEYKFIFDLDCDEYIKQ